MIWRGILLTFFLGCVPLAAQEPVSLGTGSYLSAIPPTQKGPPDTIYATAAVPGKMPTNDWWSSLAWMPLSERQYPHPLAVEAVNTGLRISYPGSQITANKDAIFGFMPAGNGEDLVLGHSTQADFTEARVAGWSDWFVTANFAVGERQMDVSYGHGSPFVFARYTQGNPRITFAHMPEVWSGDATSPVLGISVQGRHYGLFGPRGATWKGLGTKQFDCSTERDYFSLAILPDNQPATLAWFQKHAYAHVTDTKVSWKFNERTSTVTTTFTATTKSHEGSNSDTVLALYPHQWRHTDAKLHEPGYHSVRGPMKLITGTSFETNHRFTGVLPGLPRVDTCDATIIRRLIDSEIEKELPPQKDTYWEGKWLGQTATLIPIAEQYGHAEGADRLRERLKARLEMWLTAKPGKTSGLFAYDERWGTLIGYPASFGSETELNDHHFHYGYFIRAAAEVARHDPAWAARDRWGGMIELLIRDIATPRRDDRLFPFLRNFDPYAGHSWASGHAKFGDGNNNESSSEAMNAWYGMILWGEFTNNRPLRDLGIYLYTTEMIAIQEYWFDTRDANHPADFTPAVVTMIWGGKGANATWFSANREVVHGINWLPIHGGSLYLGHDVNYVRKNYQALVQDNGGDRWDEWADLVWMYQAVADPAAALAKFEAGQATAPRESGNSLANTYQWIATLKGLGQVNAKIAADHTLFAVLDSGPTRSYVVYNHAAEPRTVTFSDGFQLSAGRGYTVKQRRP